MAVVTIIIIILVIVTLCTMVSLSTFHSNIYVTQLGRNLYNQSTINLHKHGSHALCALCNVIKSLFSYRVL